MLLYSTIVYSPRHGYSELMMHLLGFHLFELLIDTMSSADVYAS
jgi:hypothetical protein